MKRWGLGIAFSTGALVALAFVSEDVCDGFDSDRRVAIAAAAICVGGLGGVLMSLRWTDRAAWILALVTSIVAFGVLTVLFMVAWAGECAR